VTQVVTTGLFNEDIPLTSPTRTQRAKVARMLKRFGLHALRRRSILSLSYGQRRLVLVARALIAEPPGLLMDEIFNGLGSPVRVKLRRLLERSLKRSKAAWVLTTHRSKELPLGLTHVAHIDHGRLTVQQPIRTPRDLAPPRRPKQKRAARVPLSNRRK